MRRTKLEALETREALLDAAESVFFEKGVSRTSLNEIAVAASVTRGAIYWHFADKAALFEAMQERGRLPQEYVTRLLEAENSPDPLQRVEQVGLESLVFLNGHEQTQRILTILLLRCEAVGEMAVSLKRIREADENMLEVVRAAFQAAERRGALGPDWTVVRASLAYCAAISGLITQWLRDDKAFDLMEVAAPMMRAMFAGFRREGAGGKGS